MSQEQLQPFGLRMPLELKAQVKDAAEREGRSMNAQIVQHLRAIYLPADENQGITSSWPTPAPP